MENTWITRNNRVVFRRLGDEMILKLMGRSWLSRLNPQGTEIWELIGNGRQWDDLVSSASVDVPREFLEQVKVGLERFVQAMVRDGLLVLDHKNAQLQGSTGDTLVGKCGSGTVLAKLAETRQPVTAKFDLTSVCNQRCYFCYSQMPARGQLNTAQWLDVIDQTAEMGVLSLDLTGGEIFTRRDIRQIISQATKRGFEIRLLTNGTLINAETAAFLAQNNVSAVQVSILGATAETHDQLAGAAGLLGKTLEGARHLLDNGIPVSAKIVASSLNVNQVEEMVTLCQNHGVIPHVSPYVGARSDGSTDTFQYRITDQDLKRLSETLAWVPERSTCNAATTMFAIGPTGDVYPCEIARIPMGNMTNTPLKDIWLSDAFERARNEHWFAVPEKCTNCILVDSCSMCPGDAWRAYGAFGQPDPEACRITHAACSSAELSSTEPARQSRLPAGD